MDIILIIALAVLIMIIVRRKSADRVPIHDSRKRGHIKLPYILTESVLSSRELIFYKHLKGCVGDKAVICPKVSLKNIFYISKDVGKEYKHFAGKIAFKQSDFLICNAETMKPLCSIELIDGRQVSKEKYEHDQYVERVYRDAGLRLLHFSMKDVYTENEINAALGTVLEPVYLYNAKSNPVSQTATAAEKPKLQEQDDQGNTEFKCPKCGAVMVRRKSEKGIHAGKEFYGCSNFPKCREIIAIN